MQQVKWAKGVLGGQTDRDAALAAGYSDHPQNWIRLRGNRKLQEFMRETAQRVNITPEKLLDALNDALDATTVKTAAFEGRIMDEREYVDHKTRIAAVQVLTRLLGLEPSKSGEVVNDNRQVNILQLPENYQELSNDELMDRMQKIRAGLLTAPKEMDDDG